MPLHIHASPSFARVVKKMHAKDKKALDQALRDVAANPAIGEEKRGDLAGVFVYKFKRNKQETLLAYELSPTKQAPGQVILLGVGPLENLYA